MAAAVLVGVATIGVGVWGAGRLNADAQPAGTAYAIPGEPVFVPAVVDG